jgi:hypothetical protein
VQSTRQAALIIIGGGTIYRNTLKEIGKYKDVLYLYGKDPGKISEKRSSPSRGTNPTPTTPATTASQRSAESLPRRITQQGATAHQSIGPARPRNKQLKVAEEMLPNCFFAGDLHHAPKLPG